MEITLTIWVASLNCLFSPCRKGIAVPTLVISLRPHTGKCFVNSKAVYKAHI